MIFAIILSYCSLHATKVFILAGGTVQLVRPKCSFWGDIFIYVVDVMRIIKNIPEILTSQKYSGNTNLTKSKMILGGYFL